MPAALLMFFYSIVASTLQHTTIIATLSHTIFGPYTPGADRCQNKNHLSPPITAFIKRLHAFACFILYYSAIQ